MTLNTAFKQVFGEGLKERGFVKVKGSHPIFARCINSEIVQIITVEKRSGSPIIDGYLHLDKRLFTVVGKAAAVYDIDLPLSQNTLGQTVCNHEIYQYSAPSNVDMDYRAGIMTFPYSEEDDGYTKDSLERAFEVTEKHLLPALDAVMTLKDCAYFFQRYMRHGLIVYDADSHAPEKSGNELFLVKCGTPAELSGDSELMVRINAELERRKTHNLQKLKEYGLITEETT